MQKKIIVIIFVAIFTLELAGGVYIGYKGYLIGDALSRTANAFYVLFVDPPRLASIGLVWNPLPSILQLPFVAFADLWRPLVTKGVAATIVNALFAAGSAVVLFKTFIRLNINKIYIAILLPLYLLNPYILFYGFNGMSEGIIFFFMIYAISCLSLWLTKGSPEYILQIAFSLALAFFCRYEAIPFAAAMGICILIIIFFEPKEKKFIPAGYKHERYFYAEGTLIILYLPFVFSILAWILFNWVIAGDPLYFLTSSYSNVAQSQYASAMQTPWDALILVLKKLFPFILVFLAMVFIRIFNKSLFRYDFFILATLILSMVGFHYMMLQKDTSYGWIRFFSYALPISFAWVPYELSQIKETGHARKFACIIIAVALVFSWGLTKNILSDPSSDECISFLSGEQEHVAAYINENIDLSEGKLLMDAFMLYAITLHLEHFSEVITTSSLDFYEVVNNPWKYNIRYILLPSPEGVGNLDAINSTYPELYVGGAEWCKEIKNFDGFKLFEVIY